MLVDNSKLAGPVNHAYFSVQKERRDFIDIAKGIGIFLVILGHAGFPEIIQWWIWSFHMPLFFLISGSIFSINKYPNFLSLFKKRNRNLLRPYLFFSLFVLAGYDILEFSKIIVFVEGTAIYGWGGIALWFIPVLYMTEIVFYFLRRFFNDKLLTLTLVSFSLIGLYFSYKNIHFPYKAEVVFTSVFFYGIGNVYLERVISFIRHKSILKLISLSVIILIANISFCFLNEVRYDMCFNVVGNYVYATIAALSGALFIFTISYLISTSAEFVFPLSKNILTYLGTNTFILLAVHQMIMMLLIELFSSYDVSNILSSLLRHSILWTIMFMLIMVINEYLPLILGKKSGTMC